MIGDSREEVEEGIGTDSEGLLRVEEGLEEVVGLCGECYGLVGRIEKSRKRG